MTQIEAIQIAEALRSKSFPELASKRIKYQFVAGKRYDFYMAVRWLAFEHRIYIEREILHFSQEAFMGCIAHEFAHVVLDMKKSFSLELWEFLAGSKNESYEERKADSLVIERGLGAALLKFHKEHGKEYKSYNASEGLTKSEIKELLKRKK